MIGGFAINKSTKKNKKIIIGILSLILLALIYLSLIKKDKHHSNTNTIQIPIPIGAYSKIYLPKTNKNCGIASEKGIIGEIDNQAQLNNPKHYLAQLIWFSKDGSIEYKIKNPLPKKSKIKSLKLFFEASSEKYHYDLKHKTDISIYINNKKVATHTITGDFGGKRGKYTPQWWPIDNSQYGKPVYLEIKNNATYLTENYNPDKKGKIKLQKVSKIGIKKLNLNQDTINIKISIDKDAKNKGGLNLFGTKFGNYNKPLTLEIEYEGEKILQPKVIDIIKNQQKYQNKTVILTVHPAGWSCPAKNYTKLPAILSRSTTMVYDDTGCIYGNGQVLIGKILTPDLHLIWEPGNETIVVKGEIKLYNNIPYLTSNK